MTTDQLEENLRSEFHRLDTRMAEARNLALPSYVAAPSARPHRWVRVAAVASVAAAVVLLIPILKPSDKIPTTRVADVSVILPGETRRQAVDRIMPECMLQGGFTPTDGGWVGSPLEAAGYQPSADMAARMSMCAKRIEDLGIAEPQIVLPGETPREAEERVTRACMVEGGFTPIDDTGFGSIDGGPPFAMAAYKVSPEATARQDVCHQRIEALGIIKQPTPAQWTAFYPHLVALVDCLTAQGFDMGTIISLDEYVSSGGKTFVSPKLAELESADTTDPKYWECVQKEIFPYTSILRT
jgi:hypothetical protein